MSDPITEAVNATLAEFRAEYDEQISQLTEQLDVNALRVEDQGWKLLTGFDPEADGGPTLEMIHDLSGKLRPMAVNNPWHKRGAQLRHAYVFGEGLKFQNVGPRAQAILSDPRNRATLFSVDAYETNNLALFTEGNFIVLRDNQHRFIAIPIHQIHGVVTDPDDTSEIRYIKRVWNANGKQTEMWYPAARFKRSNRIVKSIASSDGAPRVPVSQDTVAYIKRSNTQTGWTWGAPDSLAAFVWTKAYEGYLKDNSKLFHALAQFAWSLTSKTKAGSSNAAAQVMKPGVGGTAAMGEGNSLSSVGVPSAQVNMNNGQPLVAAVAASFGVPVIALLSSPGATGGSYGAATTLDQPTLKGFKAIQDSWAGFYEEILRDLPASPSATVEAPAIETDPVYRQIASLMQGVEAGVLWPDEVRDAVLDLLDVDKRHEGLPPKPETTAGSVVSGQGQSGAVAGGTEQGDTNHDNDE